MNPLQRPTFFFIPVVLVLGIGCVVFITTSSYYLNPSHQERVSKVFNIPQGTSLSGVAQLLEKEDLIASKTQFIILGKLSFSEKKIKQGEYALNSSMGSIAILQKIKSGNVILHEVRIIEGYTAKQIGQILDQKDLLTEEAFARRIRDPEFIHSLGIDALTLEGYLFPDTYFFPKKMGDKKIIKAMVSQFRKTMTPQWIQRAKELEMTPHEVLTLASIIEKETGLESERPVISAVFHNRIKRNIPLQSDPTVIYALPNFNGNLTRKNLSYRSPYNTYRVKGLPPGPIANPGAKSLQAALYPDDVNYFYFVSKNDGSHYFSKTLSEHKRAVQTFQMHRPSRHAIKTSVSR